MSRSHSFCRGSNESVLSTIQSSQSSPIELWLMDLQSIPHPLSLSCVCISVPQREEETRAEDRSSSTSQSQSTTAAGEEETSSTATPQQNLTSQARLWVDKYFPRSYMDLLSPEDVNRSVLTWLKQWDRTVFGDRLLTAFGEDTFVGGGQTVGRKKKKSEDEMEDTRPQQRVNWKSISLYSFLISFLHSFIHPVLFLFSHSLHPSIYPSPSTHSAPVAAADVAVLMV